MQQKMEPLKTENIFVTGATGVLGGHLLKDLLQKTNSHLFCLARGQTDEEARRRLQSFLKVYDPEEELLEAFNERVTCLKGDIVDATFGLDEQKFNELIEKVDATIHVAASTNLFTTMKKIRPINLGGTQNVINFVLKTKQKYLNYVSSYTIMGDKAFDASVNFKETDLDIGQGFEQMAYQESKFLAEKLIRSYSDKGLVWNIMRPGQIYGCSQAGHYPQGQTNVGGLFYDIFKTITETRLAFYSQTYFDIVPVDYVTSAIIHLALNRNSFYETYHLTNPDQKTYYEVVSIIKELGYPIEVVSIPVYKDMLLSRKIKSFGKDYRSATTMAFRYWFRYPHFDYKDSAKTDCTYTAELLREEKDIVCPQISKELMETYFSRGIQLNYFKSPKEMLATPTPGKETLPPTGFAEV